MKVISSGSSYMLYDDDMKSFDKLPTYTYTIKFAKMTGFFLERTKDIEVVEPKVYGIHNEKVEKVLHTFELMNRNLGVILSGDKGSGKSLFVRMLAIEGQKRGLPVIIVENFIPGIASYIQKIEQEAIFVFDEFDKTFGNVTTGENEADAQDSMLSLFDGMAPGKKMFVVTCNSLNKLSDYLVNRPGRFHYHFRFEQPNDEEIREYLVDKLDEKNRKEIDKVIVFSRKAKINYDCLRAIAFEINLGQTFEEAIQDLNIVNTQNVSYNLVLHFRNAPSLYKNDVSLDLFNSSVETCWLNEGNIEYAAKITFNTADAVYDMNTGINIIPAEKFIFNYDFDEIDDEETKERIKTWIPTYLELQQVRGKKLHYVL